MELGLITAVKYRDGAVVCNVQAIRVAVEYKNVPLLKPMSGFIRKPSEGQRVVMGKIQSDQRVIVGLMAANEENEYPSEMAQEDFTIQLDEDTTLSISEEGGSYSISISCSSGLTVEADGNIDITGSKVTIHGRDDGVVAQGVDVSGHTHYYEWTDSDGYDNTDPP